MVIFIRRWPLIWEGFPTKTEHGDWLILVTELGKIVYILADFRNRYTCRKGNVYVDEYLTDI